MSQKRKQNLSLRINEILDGIHATYTDVETPEVRGEYVSLKISIHHILLKFCESGIWLQIGLNGESKNSFPLINDNLFGFILRDIIKQYSAHTGVEAPFIYGQKNFATKKNVVR